MSTTITQPNGLSCKEQFYPFGENYCLTVHMAGPTDTFELFHDKLSQKANISRLNGSILYEATKAELEKATTRILTRIAKEDKPIGALFITLQGHSIKAPQLGAVQIAEVYTGWLEDGERNAFEIRELITYIRAQLKEKKINSHREIEIPIVLVIAVRIQI